MLSSDPTTRTAVAGQPGGGVSVPAGTQGDGCAGRGHEGAPGARGRMDVQRINRRRARRHGPIGRTRLDEPGPRSACPTLPVSTRLTCRLCKTRESRGLMRVGGLGGVGAAGAGFLREPTTGPRASALSVPMIVPDVCESVVVCHPGDMPSVANGPVDPVGPVLPSRRPIVAHWTRVEVAMQPAKSAQLRLIRITRLRGAGRRCRSVACGTPSSRRHRRSNRGCGPRACTRT